MSQVQDCENWMTHEALAEAASAAFLFEGLTREETPPLLAQGVPVAYRRGAVIFSRRHFRRALGIVLRGRAEIWRAGDGRKVLLNRLGPGDCFGAAALYGSGDEYVTDIRAKSDCLVLFIDDGALGAMLRGDPRLAENYIRFLSGRIRFLNRRIDGFTGGAAERRLVLYLLERADSGGGTVPTAGMAALARTLGIGRSSLYRSLDVLAGDGLIRRDAGGIVITDLPALRQMAGQ